MSVAKNENSVRYAIQKFKNCSNEDSFDEEPMISMVDNRDLKKKRL